MSTLTLRLGDRSFPITKKILISNCDFFDVHPEVFDERTYQVETQVPLADFEHFFAYLNSKQLPHITTANVISLSLLSTEFLVADLEEICGFFLAANRPGTSDVGPRIAALEENQLREFRLFEEFRRDFAALRAEVEKLRSITFESERLYQRGRAFLFGAAGIPKNPLLGLSLLKDSGSFRGSGGL
jgi:hypothetical protein